jgi:hypothetical protein
VFKGVCAPPVGSDVRADVRGKLPILGLSVFLGSGI